ncbi:MAG: hypothetical protein ACD_45C00101G0001, partial [uncultured bacterium]
MNKYIPRIIGFLLVCVALWCFMTSTPTIRHFINRLEYLGYDVQLRTQALTHANTASQISPVVVVDIDDRSISKEGHWPWPRSKLARLVDQLKEKKAALVVFDIFFSEPQSNIAEILIAELDRSHVLNASLRAMLEKNIGLFDDDQAFSKSIASVPTILPMVFLSQSSMQNQLPAPLMTLPSDELASLGLPVEQGYISNIPILEQSARAGGFINISPDVDGIVRRAPLLLTYQGKVYPALSLRTVLTYLNQQATLVSRPYSDAKKLEGIQIGNYVIPTDDRGSALIPFVGKSYTFSYYSATDVLNDKIPSDALENKIVLVGTSAIGLGDFQPTAVDSIFPGVEIQASLMNGILMQHFSYAPAWVLGAEITITVLLGLIAAWFFPLYGPKILSFAMVCLPAGLMYVNYLVWQRTGLVLSLLVTVFLIFIIAIFNILYGYFFESRRREQLKAIFGQYVPEKHINEMLQSKEKITLQGENREMTVLFSDIRHFTTIAEGMQASDVVQMLNAYFTPMTEIIYKYRGTVDKYIGDLIMAFWGAPLNDRRHVRHGLLAALEMQQSLTTMGRTKEFSKWPSISMGVGINSGLMSVGDMGSKFRRNYTVLGDAVNLASRLESLTKFYGVDILVSESTAHNQQDHFVFRKVDRVRVKGKIEGIDIFELIGLVATVEPALLDELAAYHQALDSYHQKQWEEAAAKMHALHLAHPHKLIYLVYVKRLEEYRASPPPADWDGVFVHH